MNSNSLDKSTEDLKSELSGLLRHTSEGLARMAVIIAELERRGVDLSDVPVPHGLLCQLRKVAAGHILPEIVIRFQCRPLLLRKISNLPTSDQEQIASGGSVKLLTISGGHLLADPMKLDKWQINQVFAYDHIRDDAEQRLYIENRQSRKVSEKRVDRVTPDIDHDGVKVGGEFVSRFDLIRALAELSRPGDIAGINKVERRLLIVTRNKS